MWFLALLLALLVAYPRDVLPQSISLSSADSIPRTKQLFPKVTVYPAPPDPYPDWNPDEPHGMRADTSGLQECKVVLKNSRYFPPWTVDGEEIRKMFLDQYYCWYDRPYGLGNTAKERGRPPNLKIFQIETVNHIDLSTKNLVGGAVDTRVVYLNAPTATIAGNWVLSTQNAHLAFDNIVVVRGSSTSEITKSAVVTFAPTPAVSLEQVIRHARELPAKSTIIPPKLAYNRTICGLDEYKKIIMTRECLPVYANISGPNTSEKFMSWLFKFGWGSDSLMLSDSTKAGDSRAFNPANLKSLDILQLIDIARMFRSAGSYAPNGLKCSQESNQVFGNIMAMGHPKVLDDLEVKLKTESGVEEFTLPICFFSSPSPDWITYRRDLEYFEDTIENKNCDNDTTKAHVAIVTYKWIEDTFGADDVLHQAIVEMEPNLAGCEFETVVPEMAKQPLKVLMPVNWVQLTPDDVPKPVISTRLPASSISPVDPIPDETGLTLSLDTKDRLDQGIVTQKLPTLPATQEIGAKKDGPKTVPLAGITVGSQYLQPTYIAGSRPAIALGTNTISLNDPAVTINSEPVSLNTKGIVVGTKTIPIPREMSISLDNAETLIIKPSDDTKIIILGSSTITVTGSEYTAAGHRIQFSGDSAVIDGISTYQYTPSRPTAITREEKQSSSTTDIAASLAKQPLDPISSTGRETVKLIAESKMKSMASSDHASSMILLFSALAWLLQTSCHS